MIAFVAIWVAVGLIAGFLAGHVVMGRPGLVFDLIIGVVGAVLGGLSLRAVYGYQANSFSSQVVVALLGAVVLLCAARVVEGPRRGHLFR